MKTTGIVSWLAIGVWLVAFAGCGSGDDETGSGDSPEAAEETVRQLPRIVGTPTDAGYFDGGVTLLGSADPNSGEALMPSEKVFPMAIRIEVEESASFFPSEYSVVIDKRRYRPHGVSFGDKRATFFSVEKFAAERIELSLGGSDQITTDKAGKLNGCQLAVGEVYLLYRVPPAGTGIVDLQYDGKDYELRASEAAELGIEPSAVKMTATDDNTSKPTGPQGLQLEVKRGQLAIGVIDDKDTEVFEVELILSSSNYQKVDLHLGKDFFLEGNAPPKDDGKKGRRRGRRSRKLFVELQEESMSLLTGTEFYDNTYKGKPVKELLNGGMSINVEPGRPITAFFVFPNPPFENGLALHFPGKRPQDMVSAGDVLGELRPAIPRGVAKIARAPIVGDPVKVNVIKGNILIDTGGKSLTAQGPGGGRQFIMLKFAIEGERQFVPRDYVLRDAADKNYYPIAAAFGNAPAQRIPGDGYDSVKLMPGEEDVVRKRKGELLYWQYAKPEFLVLFALPASLSTYNFSHGNLLLKITPVTPPIAWKQIRPNDSVAVTNSNNSKPKTAKKTNSPSTPKNTTADNDAQAASKVRFGKLLLKKDAKKARQYFEEAVRLAPESPAAKEAKQLLEDLK
ncbi:MAG: hypothetical protein HON53_11655 [Planctomycetaceae bacterium]|nr:hypothetical protein [Planctomycetaceae bacterium]MBT6155245.1 hypothetical protein [Planctomycetaceae bacterium]MBT6483239.1 hypothetical protein [Planctomycetaceae bacterium]MBT6492914.1 hypothetical protein [Planctomycetaceae bacterium]